MKRKSGIRSVVVMVTVLALIVATAYWRDRSARQRQAESTALTVRVNTAMLPLLEAHGLIQRLAAQAQTHARLNANQPLPAEVLDSANAQIAKSESLMQNIEQTCAQAEQQAQSKDLPRNYLDQSLKTGREAAARHRLKVSQLKAVIIASEALIKAKHLERIPPKP